MEKISIARKTTMTFEAIYVPSLYKSLAAELSSSLKRDGIKFSHGHCLQLCAAYLGGYKSLAALEAAGTNNVDRILDASAVNKEAAYERASELKIPEPLRSNLVERLSQMIESDLDERAGLARRIVRVVKEHKYDPVNGYMGSAVLKHEDVQLCIKYILKKGFQDNQHTHVPYTAIHIFGGAKPDGSVDEHCLINPDSALNVAKYLAPSALQLLKD